MAITDAGQICESSAVTTTNRMTLSGNVKSGALMVLYLGGRVASGYMGIPSITDSRGNDWDWSLDGTWYGISSGYRYASIAWAKAGSAMQSGTDWIEVTWNKTPQEAWISGHSYEGAAGTPTEVDAAQGSPTTQASDVVVLAGSDDLVVATVAYAYSTTTTTPLNSMTEEDTYAGSRIFIEGLRRNVTTGPGNFTAGTSFAASRYWTCVVASFPFEAMPAGGRGQPFLIGV